MSLPSVLVPSLVLALLVLGWMSGRRVYAQALPAGHRTQVPSLEALAISGGITVDGVFDEADWGRAAVASGFVQREPEQGVPASERTEVRVVYSPTTLYIGIMAYDENPDAIIDREMQRDSFLLRDDAVVIILDTFHDHRNGYFLETNSNGARTDALVTDEGRDTTFEWDGVWDSRGRKTREGWTAEVAIPFSTLRFDPSLDTWGFNIRRVIRHKNEDVYWSPITRDISITRISRAGHLTGLEGIKTGLNLRTKPFIVGREAKGDEDVDDVDAGLDIKWAITKGLSLDLTYNTDFAETEVDELQVNLTRFSLFFPEKREFFLENSGIFEFEPGVGLSGVPLLKVFFPRRIGIGPGGNKVPIDYGVRLSGRARDWSLGLLRVSTEETPLLGATTVAATDWSVLRLKRNLGERSALGFIYTDRDAGTADQNQVYGVDANFNPLSRLNLSAFWAMSDDSRLATGEGASLGASLGARGSTFGAGASWTGPVWELAADVVDVDEEFEPDVGFLLRRGVRRYQSSATYSPRPDLKGLRNLTFGLAGDLVERDDGETDSASLTANLFGFVMESEDGLVLSAVHEVEDLTQGFEIFPGIAIPAGEYDFDSAVLSWFTNASRRVSVSGVVQAGDFFDGERRSTGLTLRLRPNRHLRSETAWSYNDIEVAAGDFTTNIVRERLDLSLTPYLFSNALIQYSDLADSLALNLRFNWIYKPGADLILVFNQNWDAPSLGRLRSGDREVILKFTYFWEF